MSACPMLLFFSSEVMRPWVLHLGVFLGILNLDG